MRKFRIEILISMLTIIIGLVVTTIGYLSYKSLTKIVVEIKEGTQPDNKVAQIKDISANLTLLEQTVRFYLLTNSNDDLEQYYLLEDSIYRQIEILGKLNVEDEFDKAIIDSFIKLSNDKIDLWEKILSTQISNQSFFPSFSQVYSKISEQKPDSTKGKNGVVSETLRNNSKAEADTARYKTLVETDVRRKIRMLEWELYKKQKKKNVIESELVEKNVVISSRINELIRMAEDKNAADLIKNTEEVNQLADQTIKRLAVYTLSAVVLLILTFFVLFIYLRKSRIVNRILIKAREKAEALGVAKEQFAANVSHELRTPVNSIYGLAEQLQHKKLDQSTSEIVSVIFNSASHLRNIVNDTLDFSKIQSQKLVLDKINFSPKRVFSEVISLFKGEAKNKGISLNFDWTGETPGVLVGDSFRLKQIVINLVGNAIKYTEKGEVAVKVQGLKISEKVYELFIQVIDTGIGIDPGKINSVFDEYVQIDNPSGKKYKGTGLGLSIVKKLVDLHNGEIKIESEQGKGTCVTLKLKYDEGDELQPEMNFGITTGIQETFKKLLVLIADDEEYNRFLLKTILKKWGIRYSEVQSGSEVVLSVQSEKPDIVLMDLHMPGMNGAEAAKSILKDWPEIVIVAVSATIDEKERQACLDAGMKGFLFKPFSEKELFDMLDSVVQTASPGKTTRPDFSEYIKRFSNLAGGDGNFFSEMILLFIKSMETGIGGIEEALKTGNWEGVAENAHRMAAPLKHIAATRLYNSIKQLEKMAQNQTPAEPGALYFEIKPEIVELIDFLKLYLDKNK